MKKCLSLIVLSVLVLWGCSREEPDSGSKNMTRLLEIVFPYENISVKEGETITLKAEVRYAGSAPKESEFSWNVVGQSLCSISILSVRDSLALSDDPQWDGISVVVSSVKGIKQGTVNAFLSCGLIRKSCTLQVTDSSGQGDPVIPKGSTDLSQPLVWNTMSGAEYTEAHCPDWSTSGSNSYSHGSGKGIVLPEGGFSATGRWVKGSEPVSHTPVFVTSAEGHYAVKKIWTGDAMVFTVPVSNLPAGKAVKFETCLQTIQASPKYYSIEFSQDGLAWKTGISDSYISSPSCNCMVSEISVPEYFSAYTLDYPVGANGNVYVRIKCVDASQTEDGRTVSSPTTGTLRICGNGDISGPTVSLMDIESPLEVSVINGTTISAGNNLCGLISDTAGKGIPGVPVTDGFHYVLTDNNGVYQMKADPQCRKVYYSLPSGYRIAHEDNSSIASFYSLQALDLNRVNRRDFVLEERTAPVENFTLLCIGDPQLPRESAAKRYADETIADIKAHSYEGDETVAIVLGDIVANANAMWPAAKTTMKDVPGVSFYFNIGNHDHDAAASNQYDAEQFFYRTFGPVDYSFNVGKVHFVCMNDVRCTTLKSSMWDYSTGLTDSQMQWLLEDLSMVQDKENTMVVFCAHISITTTNAIFPKLLGELCKFATVHLMYGHTHYQSNGVLTSYTGKSGLPVYRHIHGAACGGFWTSNINVNGEPISYGVYTVHGNRMHDWVCRHVGMDDSEGQIMAFDGNEQYNGDSGYRYNWYQGHVSSDDGYAVVGKPELQSSIIAAVWAYESRNWTVEFFQNGKKVSDMKSAGSMNNVASSAYYVNTGHNKSLYVKNCPVFYQKASSGNPSAETGWEIVATQTIPDSGVKHVYRCSTLHKGYDGYIYMP